MQRVAVYPGSFDPVTLGHLDVIERACALADTLVIAVGVHHGKKPLFSADDRITMLEEETGEIASRTETKIEVVTFDGLVVDIAREVDATILIRGLRDGTDFNYEMQMAGMNGEMAPEVHTVFLPASGAVRHIAASLVRQIAGMSGDIDSFVSPNVAEKLRDRFA